MGIYVPALESNDFFGRGELFDDTLAHSKRASAIRSSFWLAHMECKYVEDYYCTIYDFLDGLLHLLEFAIFDLKNDHQPFSPEIN